MLVGYCREAARDHSPGLQPWVGRPYEIALKGRPTGFGWNPAFGMGTNLSDARPTTNIGAALMQPASAALSGRIPCGPFPGLKPWAMMYSRFAANPGER